VHYLLPPSITIPTLKLLVIREHQTKQTLGVDQLQPALVWTGGNEGNEDVNQTPDLLPFVSFVHFCSDAARLGLDRRKRRERRCEPDAGSTPLCFLRSLLFRNLRGLRRTSTFVALILADSAERISASARG
jgi:hypothetical protein